MRSVVAALEAVLTAPAHFTTRALESSTPPQSNIFTICVYEILSLLHFGVQESTMRSVVVASEALLTALDAGRRLGEPGASTARLRLVTDGRAKLDAMSDAFLTALTGSLRYASIGVIDVLIVTIRNTHTGRS